MILDYRIVSNISSHHDFLEELKNFCITEGWTTVWEPNSTWEWTGSQYDFVAGNESFLEVTSSGYGAQTLNFRFRTQHELTDPEHEWLDFGALLGEAIDYGSATHPVLQNHWNHYTYLSIKPHDILKAWFFGNNKFILAVIKLDNSYITFISFGSPQLFDTTKTDCNFAGYTDTGSTKWYDRQGLCPFDHNYQCFFFQGGVAEVGYNIMFSSDNNFTTVGDFTKYSRLITQNSYSAVRPLMKPMIFAKQTSALWEPIAVFPIYRMDSRELLIGERITLGTEEYITFPNCYQGQRYKGIAVKIA